MLHITPQERLALGVTALLILAGAGARVMGTEAPPAKWAARADTLSDGGLAGLRAEVERESEARRVAEEPLAPGERIDPNRASAPELDRLPKVGPSLARRIVEHRVANGSFRTLGDLDEVPGVGPAVLEAITPHVALRAGPTSSGPDLRAGAVPGTTSRPGGGSASGAATPLLGLNSASAAELEALPGIGPALAKRIVEWRSEHGRFRTVDELEAVPGIGPSLLQRIAPLLRIDP